MLVLRAARPTASNQRHRAAGSVAVGEAANSPMTSGVEVKLPRTWAWSVVWAAWSWAEPHVVFPHAEKMKSSVVPAR